MQVIGNANASSDARRAGNLCTIFSDNLEVIEDPEMMRTYRLIKNRREFQRNCRHYTVNVFTDSFNSETEEPD
jgi:hypothetical protein